MQTPLNTASDYQTNRGSRSRRSIKCSAILLGIAMVVCIALGIVGIVGLATTQSSSQNDDDRAYYPNYLEDEDLVLSPVFPIMNSVNTSDGIEASSCRCGPVPLQRHEEVLVSQTGNACVGTCTGNEFAIRLTGHLVRRLAVHWHGQIIHGMIVDLTDGSRRVIGTVGRHDQSNADFTFGQGEHLVGDVTLIPVQNRDRLGYIEFSTSRGRTFRAGNAGRDNRNFFHADGRFLVGMFGRHGSDINMMAFIYTRPIIAAQLRNVQYPTLSLLMSGLVPRNLAYRTFNNDAPNDATHSLGYRLTTGSRACFVSEASTTFGMQVSVEGGVPGIVTVNTQVSWGVTSMQRREQCTDTTREENTNYELTVPALSSCHVQITQFVSEVQNLPFVADFEMTFRGGQRSSFRTHGTYQGVHVSREDVDRRCRLL